MNVFLTSGLTENFPRTKVFFLDIKKNPFNPKKFFVVISGFLAWISSFFVMQEYFWFLAFKSLLRHFNLILRRGKLFSNDFY